MKYKQIEDSEGIELQPGTATYIACCDCGLVHKMAGAIEDNGNIGLAFERDEELTNERRTRDSLIEEAMELIVRAAPLAWVFHHADEVYLETAQQWEKDAESLIKRWK